MIGFFGGSFDPVHFGHINLALEMMEIYHLKGVLFCPAFCSPFKSSSPPIAEGKHRLEMLRLAIEPIRGFNVTPFELEQGRPCYTIDTIRSLQKEGPFRLILSDDSLDRFNLWKEAQDLVRLAPPLIGMRKEARFGKDAVGDALKRGVTKTRILEISSTEIRDRVKKNLYCGHLVPSKALDYIHKHRLYS